MIAKIELPIEHDSNDKKRERKILLPVDLISLENWFESDRTTVVPNKCRVTCNGQVYKVMRSKEDIEKELESIGVKIHKVKSLSNN